MREREERSPASESGFVFESPMKQNIHPFFIGYYCSQVILPFPRFRVER
jgi:hypothetical protein